MQTDAKYSKACVEWHSGEVSVENKEVEGG